MNRSEFVLAELAGTVREYLDMPCKSLEKRVEQTLRRYSKEIQQAEWKAAHPQDQGKDPETLDTQVRSALMVSRTPKSFASNARTITSLTKSEPPKTEPFCSIQAALDRGKPLEDVKLQYGFQ